MRDDPDRLAAGLAAFLDAAPVGLGFWDADGTVVRRNRVLEGLGDELEPMVEQALRTGERSFECALSAGGRRYAVTAFPAGEGLGVAAVDDTERGRAVERERHDRRRVEGLWRASVALTAATEPQAVLQGLARAAVPDLADWCSIDVVEPDGSIRQAAVAHTDPEREPLARELRVRFPRAQEAIEQVIRTGERFMTTDPGEEMRQAMGISAAVIVPLQARGLTLGSLSLVLDSAERWNEDVASTAEALAAQAAVALDGARLHEERRRVAEAYQRSVLPDLPAVPGASVGARYRAAGRSNPVGGDFYAVFPGGDGGIRLLIGDVAGKGPEASELTSFLRHTAQAAALDVGDPVAELATVNRALLSREERFCSAILAHAVPGEDGTGLRLRIACAGHPEPLVVRRDGRVELVPVRGALLGVFADPQIGCTRVELGSGDALVLFTDGATELRGSTVQDATSSLMQTLAEAGRGEARELAEAVEHHALVRTGGELRDDLASLVIRAD